MHPAEPELVLCPDPAALAERAADRIIAAAQDAIAARGRFLLALAGGSTPEKTYALLAQPQRSVKIDWAKTWLFMGDERLVPVDDPRSNLGMARRSLINHVPIPGDHILAVTTDLDCADEAAACYARTLAAFFGTSPIGPPPVLDLILLGLGDDGHTASLFPGKPALDAEAAWVAASPPGVLPPPVDRVTLTYRVLNAAHEVLFLVAGANKAAVVAEILEGKPDPRQRPAAGVRPTSGKLVWLLDDAAASRLTRRP